MQVKAYHQVIGEKALKFIENPYVTFIKKFTHIDVFVYNKHII